MGERVELYDTTLRDGAQGPRVKFSFDDQLRVIQELDALGISYIEAGQPGSNPKAAELFQRARDLSLEHAQLVAFGSTRHPRKRVHEDENVKSLLAAGTSIVTIFAKSSVRHVREVLGVSLKENLKLVDETVRYLRENGRRVFLDAEHFFDGFFENSTYALEVLATALEAGAEVLVLCETNGGRLPHEVAQASREVRAAFPGSLIGIHTHNDTGCAVANSLAAVLEGARHVQGTINGYGERTGNANLCTIMANLQLKMGFDVVTPEQLRKLTHTSRVVAELANMTPRDWDPYVGKDAFTHKGGMHVDAVRKIKASYEHIDPTLVGNVTYVAVSEVSGRSSLVEKAAEFGITLERDNEVTRSLLAHIKELEHKGYEFEGAEASLELIIRRALGHRTTFFHAISFHVSVTYRRETDQLLSEATVKVRLPDGTIRHTVSEGNGPVDALNNALRKALEDVYPELNDVHLEDYKVRILDGKLGTRAKTRVLIESGDGERLWNTVGVSENIICASFEALLDSIEYKLFLSRGNVAGQ